MQSDISNTTIPFIDSHAHLSHIKNMDPDIKSRIAGLYRCLDVGLHPSDIKDRLFASKEFNNLDISAGIYPSHCGDDIDTLLEALSNELNNNDIIAIGECGIDLYHDYGSLERQTDLFEGQIELSIQHKLPLLIHARESLNEVYDSLRKYIDKGHTVSGIMHCFSGGAEDALRFQNLGLYISFAGNLTYKSATLLQEACKACNRDLLLFETDSPYLSPVPKRGKKNNPGNVQYIYQFAAELLQTDIHILAQTVKANYSRLFSN